MKKVKLFTTFSPKYDKKLSQDKFGHTSDKIQSTFWNGHPKQPRNKLADNPHQHSFIDGTLHH